METHDFKRFTTSLVIDDWQKLESLFILVANNYLDDILGEQEASRLYDVLWQLKMRNRF